MRRLNRGAATGIAATLVALLLAAGGQVLADRTTGRPHTAPSCRTVAFMSMTGVAPECR
ncbi:hypothetical protein ACIPW5_13290 [Streptomyces sp. NPDC090077]|uniref:hypothetical protein n=1 Tax=Streptomyces sp. NPDC090077 TaxID=3365938 RepID=UPI00381C6033